MEQNKMSVEQRLALIYTDVQKLTKHFKLDRRTKGSSGEQEETESAATDENDKLFREILARIGEIADRKEFTAEQTTALMRIENTVDKALRDFQDVEYRGLKSLLETIRKRTDELGTETPDSTVNYRHTFDLGSSKVFLSMVVMGLVILGLSYVVGSQRRTIGQFRDNDLKYRYIEMKGQAEPADILMLREFFDYNRNSDSIKTIRQRVERYEKLIREESERQARARLNAEEAEKLRQEAEMMKMK